MRHSVSAAGTSIQDRLEKSAKRKKREEKKKRWGPFQYFVIVSSVLIVAMWAFILFGGQERPTNGVDFQAQQRVFLFMVDAAIKRYADREGNRYPERLVDLVPGYLNLADADLYHLEKLIYRRDANSGYRLSFANPKADQMNLTLTSEGIQFKPSGSEGG